MGVASQSVESATSSRPDIVGASRPGRCSRVPVCKKNGQDPRWNPSDTQQERITKRKEEVRESLGVNRL